MRPAPVMPDFASTTTPSGSISPAIGAEREQRGGRVAARVRDEAPAGRRSAREARTTSSARSAARGCSKPYHDAVHAAASDSGARRRGRRRRRAAVASSAAASSCERQRNVTSAPHDERGLVRDEARHRGSTRCGRAADRARRRLARRGSRSRARRARAPDVRARGRASPDPRSRKHPRSRRSPSMRIMQIYRLSCDERGCADRRCVSR